MYLTKENKEQIFATYAGDAKNTGSPEAQVALFTKRIAHLTEHLKKNRKDFVTQRSLIIMVSKRRKLLTYLKSQSVDRYKKIIGELGLRK